MNNKRVNMKILNMLSYSDFENYNYKETYAKETLVNLAKHTYKKYLLGAIKPSPKQVGSYFERKVKDLFFGVMILDENFEVIKDDLMLLVDENNIKFNEHLEELVDFDTTKIRHGLERGTE